jgi:hypothetical protein
MKARQTFVALLGLLMLTTAYAGCILLPREPTDDPSMNIYRAEDAADTANSNSDNVLIAMSWQHAQDGISWAFLTVKLESGDNVYDCTTDGTEECLILQDGSDNASWEYDERLMLVENGEDICSSPPCMIGLYLVYRGGQLTGTSDVVVE